jgi:hypothetical protein
MHVLGGATMGYNGEVASYQPIIGSIHPLLIQVECQDTVSGMVEVFASDGCCQFEG